MKQFTIMISLAPEPNSEAPADRAVRLCAEFERRGLARFPLTWHLPSADACGRRPERLPGFREPFLDRHERFGDTIVPMGLTGAPNVALHVDEIEAEIGWSLTNIWKTGVSDALRTDPRLIVPRSPDFGRRGARAVYESAPVPVGMIGTGVGGHWLSVAADTDGAVGRAIPVIEAASVRTPDRRGLTHEIQRRRRAVRPSPPKESPVVVRCRVERDADREKLFSLLVAAAEAAARPGWQIVPLDPASMSPREPSTLIDVDSPHLPADVAEAITGLRRRRGSRINTRRILEHFAGSTTIPLDRQLVGRPDSRPARAEREFIASMVGQASIPGSGVTAHFSAGRLCGLHAGTTDLKGQAAESYLVTADGRRCDEVVESCFSFQSEISRGLRSESLIADRESSARVRIRSEYSFVGDYDALIISQHVLLEGGSPGDTVCVLAAPVRQPTRCAVTGRFTDGSTYDAEVSWKGPQPVFRAEAFEVWDGESRYSIVPLTPDGRPTSWTVTRSVRPVYRVILGGHYRLGVTAEHRRSFLMIRGDLDDELVERSLSGKLPLSIRQEVAAGSLTVKTLPLP